jgi:hypothetical protein
MRRRKVMYGGYDAETQGHVWTGLTSQSIHACGGARCRNAITKDSDLLICIGIHYDHATPEHMCSGRFAEPCVYAYMHAHTDKSACTHTHIQTHLAVFLLFC